VGAMNERSLANPLFQVPFQAWGTGAASLPKRVRPAQPEFELISVPF